jgi:hypothetical protein
MHREQRMAGLVVSGSQRVVLVRSVRVWCAKAGAGEAMGKCQQRACELSPAPAESSRPSDDVTDLAPRAPKATKRTTAVTDEWTAGTRTVKQPCDLTAALPLRSTARRTM